MKVVYTLCRKLLDKIIQIAGSFIKVTGIAETKRRKKQMNGIRKITKTEIAVLAIMLLCYMASLYFLIMNSRNYALLFYILQGILVVVCYCVSKDRFTQAILELQESTAGFSPEAEDGKDELIAGLRQENEELSIEGGHISEKLGEVSRENEALLQRLSELEREKELAQRQNELLPQPELLRSNNLLAIIRQTFEKYTDRCMERGIRLELSTSYETVQMQCDEKYIRTLLDNIIGNSMKYMNRNGVFLITISDIGEDGIFMVCKDNGNGLPAKEADYIFDLNYRGSNHRDGDGLGLAQVKAIAEHYNGRIYAKCGMNEGMAIYIQFPVENKG